MLAESGTEGTSILVGHSEHGNEEGMKKTAMAVFE